MRAGTKRVLGAALGLGLLWAAAPRAAAASSATLSIEVTVLSNLSVKVDGVSSSTDASASWNASAQAFLAATATATVTNDSGAQTEKWGLSTLSSSIDQGTAGNWVLSSDLSAVGPDQFAVQAVFGAAATPKNGCPPAASPDWSGAFAPPLMAGAPAVYTSTQFADTALNAGGAGSQNPDVSSGAGNGRMFAGSSRALCWRVKTPASTSTVDTQTIVVIVSALLP